MIVGAFGKFGHVDNIEQKLRRFRWEHDLQGENVIAVVQVDNKSALERKLLLEGLVIDHVMLPSHQLVRHSDGSFYIKTEIKPSPIWSKFITIGNGYVMVENAKSRILVFGILSRALNGTQDFISYINFDLQRLAKDFRGHWLTGIMDRQGHWQSGLLYGDYLEQDDVVGPELVRAAKNQVGFETNYFGTTPVNVRVSRAGTVQVYSNVTREQFLNYVFSELDDYMVELSALRGRR